MTDKEKEAIDTLFHLEHINGYVDLYKEHDVIIKSDVLLKWKNATKTVLNLIQTQQAEIEQLKIARNGMDLLLKQKTAEIEKKDKEKNIIYDFLYKFGSKFSGSFMKALSEDGFDIKKCENCEYETCDCKDCIKQYFERKVEDG